MSVTGLHNIPMDEYHRDMLAPVPSLSAGVAELLVNRSPAHAWAAHPRLGNLAKQKTSGDMDVGTIAHALLFEGVDHMAVIHPQDYPAKNGNVPDGWTNQAIRAARDEARALGKVPVLKGQEDGILAVVEAAKAAIVKCPDLEGYPLSAGVAEQSMIWTEGATYCRSRPDWLSHDRKLIIDAKFTKTSANPDDFVRQVLSMSYDLRAAFYMRGNRALFETDCTYVFLVCEVEPPYATACIALDPAFIALGASKVETALRRWEACMQSNRWPAYERRLCYISPPPWAEAKQMEQEVSEADESLAGEM